MAVDLGSGDILMLRLEFSDELDLADTALCVLHYQITAVEVDATGLPAAIRIPAAPMLTSWGPIAYGSWSAAWATFASEDVVMTGCSMQKVRGEPRSTLYHHTPDPVVSGGVAGDSLPMQDAMTLLKQTGIGQRWGMGRMFVPGIPEANAKAGRINAAGMTNLQAVANRLLTTFTVDDGAYTTTLAPVLWSPESTDPDHPRPERINRITASAISNDIVKTQRRRRPGKGS